MIKRALVLVMAMCFVAHGQWTSNPVILCDTANRGANMLPKIASDGAGGAYVCWEDARNGNNYDIFAQYVDSSGTVRWQKNGLAIAAYPLGQEYPRITESGNGDAFIAWEDSRSNINTFVYAQRVNKHGDLLWGEGGKKVSEESGLFISLHNDGKGGVLVGWIGGGIYDTYVQRLDSTGNRMWSDSGVQVANQPGIVGPGDVSITTDGAGGAIIAWGEGADNSHENMYIQRLNSKGEPLWQTNGILLNDTSIHVGSPVVSSDGQGGAIVLWGDFTANGRAQRVNSQGKILWQQYGVPLPVVIINSTGGGGNTPDGKGGSIVGVRLRRHYIDSTGNKLWGTNGVAYSTNPNTFFSSQVSDGNGGVLIFAESQFPGEGQYLIAQWIDKTGKVKWYKDGEKIIPSAYHVGQFDPGAVSNGDGSAIVSWDETDTTGYYSIRALKIDTTTFVTSVVNEESAAPRSLNLYQDYPNPFNPSTLISYQLSVSSVVSIKVYDLLGREIAVLVDGKEDAGEHTVRFYAEKLPTGIYFYRLTADNTTITKKMVVIH
jgi:hypothetical protein